MFKVVVRIIESWKKTENASVYKYFYMLSLVFPDNHEDAHDDHETEGKFSRGRSVTVKVCVRQNVVFHSHVDVEISTEESSQECLKL